MSVPSLSRTEGDVRYTLVFNPFGGLRVCPRCHRWRRVVWVFVAAAGELYGQRMTKSRQLCADCGREAERYCRGGAGAEPPVSSYVLPVIQTAP